MHGRAYNKVLVSAGHDLELMWPGQLMGREQILGGKRLLQIQNRKLKNENRPTEKTTAPIEDSNMR